MNYNQNNVYNIQGTSTSIKILRLDPAIRRDITNVILLKFNI
ncbi:MAG: hypothetical protein RR795_01350 [Cetobacterium sp.]